MREKCSCLTQLLGVRAGGSGFGRRLDAVWSDPGQILELRGGRLGGLERFWPLCGAFGAVWGGPELILDLWASRLDGSERF